MPNYTPAVETYEFGQPETPHSPPPQEEKKGIQILRVGADVEVFLVNANGKPVPSVGLIGGSKTNPRPIITHLPGYAIQEDNVALEYNIPPAKDMWEFVYSIQRVKEAIFEELRPLNLTIAEVASMKFVPEDLMSDQARRAGCDPDVNVWERIMNDSPKLDETIRAAGGHVHTSILIDGEKPRIPENLPEIECLTMLQDIYLAVPMNSVDPDRIRRRWYGRAGAMRLREDYGGWEYRALSPVWTSKPSYVKWVYETMHRIVNIYNGMNMTAHTELMKWKDLVEAAVNRGDPQATKEINRAWGIMLPS